MQKFGEHLLTAIAALCLLVGGIALATDYTITFTGDDEKVLHKLVDVENAQRVSQGLTPFTTSQYLTYATTNALNFQWRRIRRRLIRQKPEADKNNFVGVN